MLRLPRVYPILDTESLGRRGISLAGAAAASLEGGAAILQIRHKSHWSRDFFAASQEVARLCREAGASLIVNDRADFAALLNAGLHLDQDDLDRKSTRLYQCHLFLAASKDGARLCREAGASLIVNDRADFAALLNAGLHLDQDD